MFEYTCGKIGKTYLSSLKYFESNLSEKTASINLLVIQLNIFSTLNLISLLSIGDKLNFSAANCIISYIQQKLYNILVPLIELLKIVISSFQTSII